MARRGGTGEAGGSRGGSGMAPEVRPKPQNQPHSNRTHPWSQSWNPQFGGMHMRPMARMGAIGEAESTAGQLPWVQGVPLDGPGYFLYE